MDYKKPQSTLVQDGAGIYPLTTADQVILADGSRMEKNGKISADSAADSAKLGGKAPEYYLRPPNLLDNGNFTNPVNRRGGTSYSLSSAAGIYSIDRWILYTSSAAAMTLEDAGLIFSGSGMLLQRFESGILPDTLTIAAKFGDGSVTLIHTKYTLSDGVTEEIRIPFTDGQTLVWAALYEGSYTSDTLPPYVPKGYAAELAECQRYYRHFVDNAFLGTAIVSSNGILLQGFIPLDTPMRINNPAIIGTLAFYESTQNQALGTPTTFVQQGNGIRFNCNLTTALTAKSVGFINALGVVGISADL